MSISLGELGSAIIADKNLAIYPSQTGNDGKVLKTNGTTVSWDTGGPNVDGFLSGLSVGGSPTNGLDLTFSLHNDSNQVVSLPKYTIHNTSFNDGTLTIQQFHTTDKIINILPSQSSNSGKVLSTDGTDLSWVDAGGGGGGGGTNVDGFLSGLSVGGSPSNGLDLTFSLHNGSNQVVSLPKYLIHNTSFNDGTLTIQQFHTSDKTINILPSQLSNSGKVLSTDGTNLSWVDAGGGGTSSSTSSLYKKIDVRTMSNNNLTVENTDGTTSSIPANGILWGPRIFNYIINNTLVKNRTFAAPDPMLLGYHNGQRGQTDTYNDTWYIGGYVTYQFVQSYAVRYNCWYFFRYYNTSPDITMGIYGSNDNILWNELKTFNINDFSAFSDGSQTVTETLGSSSITFPGRTTSDPGTSGTNPPGGVRRYSFANDNYYVFYMIKWIGWGDSVANSATNNAINTQTEFEWG